MSRPRGGHVLAGGAAILVLAGLGAVGVAAPGPARSAKGGTGLPPPLTVAARQPMGPLALALSLRGALSSGVCRGSCCLPPMGIYPHCGASGGRHGADCRLKLWPDCHAAVAAVPTSNPLKSWKKGLAKRNEPGPAAEDLLRLMNPDWKPALQRFKRLQAELTMDLLVMAKKVYGSIVQTRDRSYATLGLYTFMYRRPLLPKHDSDWVRRFAVVGEASKTGVRAPALRQLYTGVWLFLEYNLLPYDLGGGRLLLRAAPLGGHSEHARNHLSARKKSALRMEAAASLEARWTGKRAKMVIRSTLFPRYSYRRPAVRFLSEIACYIRVSDVARSIRWLSEINLVPKIVHRYNTDPLILRIQEDRHAELTRGNRIFHISNLRHILTVYLNVMFLMSR